MLRAAYRIVVLVVLLGGLTAGFMWYQHQNAKDAEISRLTEKTKELQLFVQRLTDEKRVAEILVTSQRKVGDTLETTLLFVEQARDGSPLPPRSFTVRGEKVYVTALSIRFLDTYMEKNDPLRGHGLILFDRIFGDQQSPTQGSIIDEPGRVPDIYRANPREVDPSQMAQVRQFETDLWKDFWKLVSDKSLREKRGVDVATGKGTYLPFEPDKLYRITVDARGNLTMDWEPVKPIYQEAMKKAVTAPVQ